MNRAEAEVVFDRRRLAWLAQDTDAYLACWHDEMVLHLPNRGAPIVGRAEYRKLIEQSYAWAQPLRFDVHHLAVDGEVVLAEWTIAALTRAENREVVWTGMNAMLLDAGLIRWWREYHRNPPR